MFILCVFHKKTFFSPFQSDIWKHHVSSEVLSFNQQFTKAKKIPSNHLEACKKLSCVIRFSENEAKQEKSVRKTRRARFFKLLLLPHKSVTVSYSH